VDEMLVGISCDVCLLCPAVAYKSCASRGRLSSDAVSANLPTSVAESEAQLDSWPEGEADIFFVMSGTFVRPSKAA